jgi:serine/threonine-protein kinase
MALTSGSRLGPYEILSPLGAGGMGEVYRAKDTKLGRDVALKILPASFTNDPERVARFRREAQVLASLNHPHIAQIHGLEAVNGTQFLVLELVDGESLDKRIARGPIPVDEALGIAKQIAEALEAAHEKGIIHRDLKPANIALTKDGNVKVLDFGLAKAVEATSGSSLNAMNSPTITSPAMMTGVGMILGTAAYMAPEQAKGRPADKRSDIWAFGCVFYEMMTGNRAFEGDDVSDTLAAVLRGEPDWGALPVDLPSPTRVLLRRCLAKGPQRRIADISVALFALDEDAMSVAREHQDSALVQHQIDTAVAAAQQQGAAALAGVRRAMQRRRMLDTAAAVLATGAVVGAVMGYARRPAAPRVTRLLITPPPATAFSFSGVHSDLAITPDGMRVVYVSANGTALVVRPLDQLEGTVLSGVGRPFAPFVSPDGGWIGFVDAAFTLKKVAINGGPAVPITQADGVVRGASWSQDGNIVFATSNPTTGLQRVSAAGGEPTVLTRPDRARGEADHLWPEVLPGARAILFTITSLTGGLDQAQVAVLDPKSGQYTVLIRGGSDARYMPNGHLIYAAGGTLRAIGFDLTRLVTVGTPVPVISQVATTGVGASEVAVAGDGTLVYVPSAGLAGSRSLVWVDRRGREEPMAAPPRLYQYPRISPDGKRIAVSTFDQQRDLWLWEPTGGMLTRVTSDPGVKSFPVWGSDSRRLFFASEQAGPRNLFSQNADGTGTVERLTDSPHYQNPTSISPDGRRLVFFETRAGTEALLMQLAVDGTRQVTPLFATPFQNFNGEVSPDGHWLAYQANDSGAFEIYVRPYPNVNDGHWLISIGGGTRPLWARNSQELFYLAPSGALMRVGVDPGATWKTSAPTKLFEGRYLAPGGNPGRTYDISPDGQKFLFIKEADEGNASQSLVVIQHFDEELKRLVPTK